ncbi:uncharacterized protein EI90DRAFT_3072879 [Cantharellus anzutake]|uniref:uncharacterized protein n=1 Tax=Cantharellus anzutake TaxID=1750568 RepID=UPI0019075C41|nr:uncharacterized protein EI90DRAFT_3072879 [Cantharellus anzutake]KAF8325448.1 hypothetical protein EI90DRAFT_3072879 [Cantharellus anzutake]
MSLVPVKPWSSLQSTCGLVLLPMTMGLTTLYTESSKLLQFQVQDAWFEVPGVQLVTFSVPGAYPSRGNRGNSKYKQARPAHTMGIFVTAMLGKGRSQNICCVFFIHSVK